MRIFSGLVENEPSVTRTYVDENLTSILRSIDEVGGGHLMTLLTNNNTHFQNLSKPARALRVFIYFYKIDHFEVSTNELLGKF
jgi:hypothetical protein